jgi:CheY-like chemotaxis protein
MGIGERNGKKRERERGMENHRSVTILLAEDDPGHSTLIEKNLRRAGITNEIIKVDDGQKAVDFLFKQNTYRSDDHPVPILILLDLNMPVMDGYQVIKALKADERTRTIPIVVLTTTDAFQDVSRCYDLGCNVYITKPVEYGKFSEAIRNLGFFLNIVKIPEKERGQ